MMNELKNLHTDVTFQQKVLPIQGTVETSQEDGRLQAKNILFRANNIQSRPIHCCNRLCFIGYACSIRRGMKMFGVKDGNLERRI